MPTERVARSVRDLAHMTETVHRQSEELAAFAQRLVEIFNQGGRLLLLGSGPLGSVADLTANRFLYRLSMERPLLPALSLCHDTNLTATLARDGQIGQLYARQLQAVASSGDALLCMSDGGRDEALHEALSTARHLGCLTALIAPAEDEPTGELPDFLFHLGVETPSRMAEGALFLGHLLCELVEGELFGI